MDESTGSMMRSAIQKGYKTIKQLIEAEVNE
jgi:hypothetical protein